MSFTEQFDVLPFWGFFLASFIALFVSVVIGLRVGTWRLGKLPKGVNSDIGPVVAASFSLVAFMLAIVFGSVYSRYNELRHAVLDEANAIGTAFIRADLLPDADRTEVQRLLLSYTNSRIAYSQNDATAPTEMVISESKELQTELWSIATSSTETLPPALSALFIQSVNEIIDMHEYRVTVGIHHRLPGDVYSMLLGLAVLAMVLGGYNFGLNNRPRVINVTVALALAYSAVFTFTFELDRFHKRPSMNAPMIDVQEDILRSMKLPK